MKFSFPLQTLLNWKKSLEDFSRMKLGGMMNRLKAQEEEIERLTFQRLFYDQKLKEKSQKRILAGEYVLYKQFAEDSHRDLLTREEKKKRTLREIELEREKLIALTKEKKILEKLKEKKWKAFLYQMEKDEQKKNDERTVMKYQPSLRKRNS